MIEKAIEKIKAEMEKEKGPHIKIIGEYLLKNIEINKGVAEKIVNGNKTIKGALKEMENVARKRVVGGCAVLTDEEGFKIVRQYFGFEAVQDKILEVDVSEIKEVNNINIDEEVNVEEIDFNVNLDDFLK